MPDTMSLLVDRADVFSDLMSLVFLLGGGKTQYIQFKNR